MVWVVGVGGGGGGGGEEAEMAPDLICSLDLNLDRNLNSIEFF